MSHTNSTAHYELPQFLGTDKPAWLTDINGAMSAIDTAIYSAQTKANEADAKATQNTSDITTQGGQITTLSGKVSALETAQPVDEAQIELNRQNIATNAQNIVDIDNRLGHTSITGIGDGKVTGAISNLNGRVGGLENKGSVSVTADGVKTMGALLNELYALIDRNKLTHNSVFRITVSEGNYRYARIDNVSPTFINFVRAYTIATSQSEVNLYSLSANNSAQQVVVTYVNGTITGTDYSSEVKPVGQVFSILY